MSLQQLGHANNQQVHGLNIDPAGVDIIRQQASKPAG